jgi:DNA-binding phage protein
MALMRRLATLATAAEFARRYARSNPAQAAKYLDQAAAFVDKQTKGRYTAQIDGATQKVKGMAGVSSAPGSGLGSNGYTQGTQSAYGAPGNGAAGYSAPQPSSATTPPPSSTAPTTAMPKPTPPAGGPTTDR